MAELVGVRRETIVHLENGRFGRVYKYTLPALHSNGVDKGGELFGLGFYTNQTPQSKASQPKPDIRSALRKVNTSALIF